MASTRRNDLPEASLHLLEEARNRGYIEITGNIIRYFASRTYELDWTDPEEKVRAECFSWLIIERGYAPQRMSFEVPVPRRVPNDFADIVLYRDDQRSTIYLVIECKKRGLSARERRQGTEQGFGNANSLRSPYMLFDCGDESQFYDIANFPPAERIQNRLGSRPAVPPNYGLPSRFRLVAGTPTDIQQVDAGQLELRVRRAHALIWAGGRRDPLKSFDEWSKLLFAKVFDERNTPNNSPRRFQIGAGETSVQVANRVRQLYSDARQRDPSIFSEPQIKLPDDKIREVVGTIEDIGLTLIDLDVLGHAFEHFFGSIFRGDLGQFFTRRELVRFIVALLKPTDLDFVLDPTCGSGGFLLEALIQVDHHIETQYAGQQEIERRKYDFAHNNLFGIEIHEILGRVCKTNLVLHKDGHTNIEVDRSALDNHFDNPQIRPDGTVFSIVVGNPPFGDEVEEGDQDHLGTNSLRSFEIAAERNSVASEFVILERALAFLRPGGRLGMVIPDGLLNNAGELSLCPRLRRFLLSRSRILAIVSLPDHAFRKSGAQNKTSILFVQKFSAADQNSILSFLNRRIEEMMQSDPSKSRTNCEAAALQEYYQQNDYHIFLAEANQIGYNPAGGSIQENKLYSLRGEYPDPSATTTILGQYNRFLTNPAQFAFVRSPLSMGITLTDLMRAHDSWRMDPKFHLFKHERLITPPAGMNSYRLGQVLHRKEEQIDPSAYPDREFMVMTLTQEGALEPREAGKGKNPPAWFGQYFSGGSRWYLGYEGNLVFSQIDLWKGCVAIIPPEYNGAIYTQEFPLYEVDREILDPYYLKLLLRSSYFQRAIRAITTGHSNRRRTQQGDFEYLEIFLPNLTVQQQIGETVRVIERQLHNYGNNLQNVLDGLNGVIIGETSPDQFLERFR